MFSPQLLAHVSHTLCKYERYDSSLKRSRRFLIDTSSLVANCLVSHKTCLLHVSGWNMDQSHFQYWLLVWCFKKMGWKVMIDSWGWLRIGQACVLAWAWFPNPPLIDTAEYIQHYWTCWCSLSLRLHPLLILWRMTGWGFIQLIVGTYERMRERWRVYYSNMTEHQCR